MYTLYYAPGAASLAVHAALIDTGAPFTLAQVDLDGERTDEFLRLNPQGAVPALVVDGQAQTEAAALLQLLAEQHPDAQLAPAPGSPDRAAWLQWTAALPSMLGAPFRLWFYPLDLGIAEHDEQTRAPLRRMIEMAFQRIEARLSKQGPYLLGERFSTADYQLCMYMRWSRAMPTPATTLPALDRLARLVTARPAWRRVAATEGLRGWHLDGVS